MCDKYFYYQNTGTTYTNTIEPSKKTIKVTIKPNEYKSSRGCGDKLTTNNPASQYQRQKIIQNTESSCLIIYYEFSRVIWIPIWR